MPFDLQTMTFNLRYAHPGEGFNSWERRRESVLRMLQDYAPQVIGCQEVTPVQRADLQDGLGLRYACLGVGREAAGGGEQSLILYRTDSLELAEWRTFWLSERPQSPGSRGWDAALPRTCTLARFRRADQTVLILNAHLDHWGSRARSQSIRLLLQVLKDEQREGEGQVLLGDFNAQENDEPLKLLAEQMQDAFRQIAAHSKGRQAATFHAFLGPLFPFASRVDYIFVDRSARVQEAEIIRRRGSHGGYLSDHYPLRALIQW